MESPLQCLSLINDPAAQEKGSSPVSDSSSFSLVDLKGLSEPAAKMIEAISAATGAIYEPTRIRRRAKAEADALILRAEAEREVEEIRLRAGQRIARRELRRQRNVDSITLKAIDNLPPEADAIAPDEDWIFDFFDRAQDISNDQMQELWARLLAGEFSQPGSFSTRTLSILKDMDQDDSELFAKLCSAIWIRGNALHCLVMDTTPEHLTLLGLKFEHILHLSALGLLSHGGLTGYVSRFNQNPFSLRYHNDTYIITMPNDNYRVPTGKVMLTPPGEELSRIVEAHPSIEYRNDVLSRLAGKLEVTREEL